MTTKNSLLGLWAVPGGAVFCLPGCWSPARPGPQTEDMPAGAGATGAKGALKSTWPNPQSAPHGEQCGLGVKSSSYRELTISVSLVTGTGFKSLWSRAAGADAQHGWRPMPGSPVGSATGCHEAGDLTPPRGPRLPRAPEQDRRKVRLLWVSVGTWRCRVLF